MKTAQILEIKTIKPYTKGQHGTVYYHTMVLSNGDTVNIGKKTNPAFKIGDEIKYIEVEPADEYGIIKIRHPKPEEDVTITTSPGPIPYKGNSNTSSFSLSYAKDLCVAGKIDVADIIGIAETFNDWLISKGQ